ncbi:hypothetical protein C8Q78DRAFT_1141482 [Trametes maxima]|nr:hypothetical protein C8Q78DRAFT_1141482 [Trametes maxima]
MTASEDVHSSDRPHACTSSFSHTTTSSSSASPSSMAQGPFPDGSTSTADTEPRNVYTVLGFGEEAGVFDARPADTAVGYHRDILPLVVVTPSHKEAIKVNALNKEIISQLRWPVDIVQFKMLIEQLPTMSTIFPQVHDPPIYAFKVASETGIYYPYDWTSQLMALTDYKKALWKKFYTFKDALLWMIDKASMQPKRAAIPAGPLPFGGTTTPTRLAAAPIEVSSNSTAELRPTAESRPSSPSKLAAQSAVTPSSGPGGGRPARAASPIKRDKVAADSHWAKLGGMRTESPLKEGFPRARSPPEQTVPSSPSTSRVLLPPLFIEGQSTSPFTPRKARQLAPPTSAHCGSPTRAGVEDTSAATAFAMAGPRRDGRDGLQCLLNKMSFTKTRVSYRHRSKKKGVPLTSVQKAQLRLQRQERTIKMNGAIHMAREDIWKATEKMHADFPNHTTAHFFQRIIHRWNAFLSKEVASHNAAVAAEGEDRKPVADQELLKDLGAKWKSMSKEEQVASTEDTLQALRERHEDHKRGTHTVPIQAFHDARATVATVKQELEDLHARTDIEAILLIARSDTSSYVQPLAFATSKRLTEFVHAATKSSLTEFALKMEGFCVSGMKGVAKTYVEGLIALKKEAAVLILTKLREACPSTRGQIVRISYTSFDTRITLRFGIIIENWPLKKFCAPGEINSRPELDILVSAWKSGATRFRTLDDEEWAEWRMKWEGAGGLAGRCENAHNEDAGGDVGADTKTVMPPPAPAAPITAPTVTLPPGPIQADPGTPPTGAPTDAPDTMAANMTTACDASWPETFTTLALPAATTFSVSGLASTAPTSSVPLRLPIVTTPPPSTVPCKRSRNGQTNFIAVDVVTGPDGRPVAVSKRPARKERKGKTSAAAAPTSEAAQASGDTNASADALRPQKKPRVPRKSKKAQQQVAEQSACAP